MLSPTTAIVQEPYLLAFFFHAGADITVSADVMSVATGVSETIVLTKSDDLSNSENSVYTGSFIPSAEGWYVAQYRAIDTGGGAAITTSVRRFHAAEEEEAGSGTGPGAGSVISGVEAGGVRVMSVETQIEGMSGLLSFRTGSN